MNDIEYCILIVEKEISDPHGRRKSIFRHLKVNDLPQTNKLK